MAKTVANLAVALSARTKRFKKQMRDARRTVSEFASGIKSLATRTAKYGAALTGIAAGALTYMVKKQFEAIDATGKLAARIGTSTEALVGFRHAAKITGSSTEALDKAFDMLAKRLGEVATFGTGEAKYALDAIGMSAEELMRLDPEQQFLRIADAVKKLGTQSEKAAVAAGLFGRSGIQLVNMLDLGSDGLMAMRKEAERLGITFSRIDSAKIEMANDAITRMKQRAVGFARAIAITVAPFVEAFADAVSNVGIEGENLQSTMKTVMQNIIKFVGKAIESFNEFKATMLEAAAATRMAFPLFTAPRGSASDKSAQDVYVNPDGSVTVKGGSAEPIDTITQGLIEQAAELRNRDPVGDILKWFNDLTESAEQRARKILGGGKGLAGIFDEAQKAIKGMPTARDIALSRVFIGGSGSNRKGQTVHDPILAEKFDRLLALVGNGRPSTSDLFAVLGP